jgi:hypothetical protein
MEKNTYSSDSYPSVITGEIWNVVNVIDVPDSIKREMSNTMARDNFDTCFLWEFVFPKEKINTRGYLVIIVYGQETWGDLDCAQAFYVGMIR